MKKIRTDIQTHITKRTTGYNEFRGRREKRRKNIFKDNPPRNNQHALALKEEDTTGNPIT